MFEEKHFSLELLIIPLTGIRCFINRFTSLCKNLFNLLEFLAEAF